MFDFQRLVNDGDRYNFHSHTEFCDGRAQMQAFAAEAVKSGFKHWGFSPHSPVPIVSPCNMRKDKVADFVAETERLADLYCESGTVFYKSMEIDYLGREWNAANEYFVSLPLDYRISSVHFIPNKHGELIDIDGRYENFARNMTLRFDNDLRYVVETFYERSIMMVETGGFDLIGHPDKIALNASYHQPGITDEPWYRGLTEHLARVIASSGISAELNTKARSEHGCFFPDNVMLEHLVRLGVPIVVNSDAHVPALINASRDEALVLLKSIISDATILE